MARVMRASGVLFGTAGATPSALTCPMTLPLMKSSAAVLWILGVVMFFVLTSRGVSMPNGIAVAALAILPPILLWFWWNDPEPTMSESIHEVRDGASSRAPARRD
jgi:hypothetical protein